MRDVATTALEVAGLLCIAAAIGVVTFAAVGLALAGVVLLTIGIIEGRR